MTETQDEKAKFAKEYDVTFRLLKMWDFQNLPALVLWFAQLTVGTGKGWIDHESSERLRKALKGYDREKDEECTKEITAAGEAIRKRLLGEVERETK